MKRTIFFLLGCASLALFSCKKEKTSWDTGWDIPVAKGSIDFTQFVEDSALAVNPDQSYQLVLDQELYAVKIDTLITIPDTSFVEPVALSFPINGTPGFEFAQNIEEHHFEMNGAEIKHLRFGKGWVDVNISSPLATVTKYILEIPSASKDGVPFVTEVIVPPGTNENRSVKSVSLDFAGYDGDMRGIDMTSSNKIQTRVIAKIDESGVPITVNPTDTVYFSITFRELVPDYTQGYFGQQSLDQTTSFGLEALKNIQSGSLKLEEVNFDFIVENGLKVLGNASLDYVQGKNSNTGNDVAMNHPSIGQNLNINPASGSWSSLVPSEYILHFDDNNSNAKAFIENLPDSILLAYKMQLNPFGNISGGTDAFYPQSELKLRMKMNMPLAFSTDSLTYVDSIDFDFQQDFDNSHIYAGNLILQYKNSFPFAAHAVLDFVDANNDVLFSLNSAEGINGGTVNVSSLLDLSESGNISIPISNQQVQQINLAKKIAVKFIFDTPAYPNTVDIYEHYKLDFHLKSNIRATVKL